jgi:hypothetical protein
MRSEETMHRVVVASVLAVGCVAYLGPVLRFQSAAADGKPAIRACSLLTKELVTQVTPQSKEAFALVIRIPPSEDALGASGSACEYGGIHLQIDPFPPATFERQREIDHKRGLTWVPVPDVGETAYFRDNKGRWGELFVRTSAHVFTIQMGVPTGRTVESIKPNVIALAKAIDSKLR